MTIKLIAVDMDGTFLNDDMNYNKSKFMELYKKMKKKNIAFVVASGNQYHQLKSFFSPIQNEISYVAENGAYVLHQNEELFSVDINSQWVTEIIDVLTELEDISFLLCGKDSAYVLDSEKKEFIEDMTKYYHRLKKIQNFEKIEDQILKFALACPPNQSDYYVEQLSEKFKGMIKPVSSGQGFIDLIDPQFNKATGINILQKKMNISADELLVFGDSGNDLEMLEMTTNSYAMKNASDKAKNAAKHLTLSNNNEGVLKVIELFV
ncbi:Cof-type HAD-IIB family hydrolase [Lacticigenium naphthae]|uniref:Cof-type HAD-IIB family hydrolase n=1 Tax=Lacticigenium naphthae TaxID=515351 RepID=UPI000410B4E5|nr:Cof-type HAD-IIB family hydrolase [Lacticigenium naphthae]